MTEAMTLNMGAFNSLTTNELFAVQGGTAEQALYYGAGTLAVAWTPVAMAAAAIVGASVGGVALVGIGIAVYCFSQGSH